ncbi:hypothetical protein [Thiolapillus sp.]|uniref:hypothetical protein n=1 Tax=Thiolapillus sp. TaxID=2017437 RepID=UPI0025F7459E|nr:hypothetical protein [Thiolapillus sp.]
MAPPSVLPFLQRRSASLSRLAQARTPTAQALPGSRRIKGCSRQVKRDGGD